jgi:hypothetical protein
VLGTTDGQDQFLLAGLAASAKRQGIIPTAAQVYGFKIAPVLGGKIGIGNVEAIDFVVSLNILGQLHEQVRNLPPGTPSVGSRSRPTVERGRPSRLPDDQVEALMFGEVLKVLAVESRERQAIGKGTCGDPRVIGWPGSSSLDRGGRDPSPSPGDVLAVRKDDHPAEPVLQSIPVASSPPPQLRPLG